MRLFIIVVINVILVLSLILAGCGPGGVSQSPPETRKPASEVNPVREARPSWQEEWETILAASKKEGKVSLAVTYAPSIRNSLAGSFKGKYGLDIEYLAGNINEILPKMEAERRSGIYTQDIIMSGLTALFPIANDLESLKPVLILPDVKDVNVWRDKKPPFYDEEGKQLMFLSRVGPTMVINTQMTGPEPIKSWRDLLDPKWKEKIMLFDPSIPSAGNYLVVVLAEIMSVDYLKELAKQEPVIMRDKRLNLEWVAKAKYPIAMAADLSLMEEMRAAGAPLVHVVPKEGTHFGSGIGAMAMFSKAAHPNAARVFVNWFLSKEGQALFGKIAKEQSRRIDIVPDMPPDRIFQEGIKYVDFDTPYMLNKTTEIMKSSKEIFAASYK